MPRANEILDLQADTLAKAPRRRPGRRRRTIGLGAEAADPPAGHGPTARVGLDQSPQIKHLDHRLQQSRRRTKGCTGPMKTRASSNAWSAPGQIEYFVHDPPDDTRAFTRAMLLRRAGPQLVDRVDWDSVRLKLPGRSGGSVYRTIDLPHPLALTKAETGHLFASPRLLGEIGEALAAAGRQPTPSRDAASPAATAASHAAPLLLPGPKLHEANELAPARQMMKRFRKHSAALQPA